MGALAMRDRLQDRVARALALADCALYEAKESGRNRAIGLLPAGETVRVGTVTPTIYIDGHLPPR